MSEVKRYLNDGDLLADDRTYVLASDYDRDVGELVSALKELIDTEDGYGDSDNVAINVAVEKARNALRAALEGK